MSSSSSPSESTARRRIGTVAAELGALKKMTTGQLAERYRELFGEPTRSRNKDYLRKRLAWRIQELAEGGLSQWALDRIDELAATAPPRCRSPRRQNSANGDGDDRDPRIPPPGTVLRREYKGEMYEVVVLQDGFEFRGQRYRNLSRVASQITGTNWNGFLFWRLQRRTTKKQNGEGA